jgi:hypothetical protein
MVVLPLDPVTKVLGEPIELGPKDLNGVVPPACGTHDDGWIVETVLTAEPNIDVFDHRGSNGVGADDARFRIRFEPGRQCVDAIAASASRTLADMKPAAVPSAATIPMALRERYTGAAWGFKCMRAN